MAIHKVTTPCGSGIIEIETGKLAHLADGAVTVRLGDTIVIVTAVSATKIKEGLDFFPLSVEYKEKPLLPASSLVAISSAKVAQRRRKS